jgi:hypothetical protein
LHRSNFGEEIPMDDDLLDQSGLSAALPRAISTAALSLPLTPGTSRAMGKDFGVDAPVALA